MRHWISRELSVLASRSRTRKREYGAGVRWLSARRVQKSLHHRHFAVALRIWTSGHAGSGPDCAHDAGTGSDGVAPGIGDEGIGCEITDHALGRSARGFAGNPARQAHAAGVAMARKAVAQEARRSRRASSGSPAGTVRNGLEDLRTPGTRLTFTLNADRERGCELLAILLQFRQAPGQEFRRRHETD